MISFLIGRLFFLVQKTMSPNREILRLLADWFVCTRLSIYRSIAFVTIVKQIVWMNDTTRIMSYARLDEKKNKIMRQSMDLQKMCVCLHLYTQFHFDFVQQMKSVSSKRPFGEWISFMAVCIFAAIEIWTKCCVPVIFMCVFKQLVHPFSEP